MQLTIPTIAIVAATFTATLMFAPEIAGVVDRFSFDQAPSVQVSAPVKGELVCPPAAKILAALRREECQ